jgi:asparagine synthetase B (glutamine-hydrolysing)
LSRKSIIPGWYSPKLMGLLCEVDDEKNLVFKRHGYLLKLDPTGGVSREIYYASHHNLELRNPYRDRRLVEYVIKLPGYQLYYNGLYKHILRTAMRGILPDMVRSRIKPTSLTTLYNRGVEREENILSDCFYDMNAVWGKFINAYWLQKNWKNILTPETDGPEALVPWLCVSFESWINNLYSQSN